MSTSSSKPPRTLQWTGHVKCKQGRFLKWESPTHLVFPFKIMFKLDDLGSPALETTISRWTKRCVNHFKPSHSTRLAWTLHPKQLKDRTKCTKAARQSRDMSPILCNRKKHVIGTTIIIYNILVSSTVHGSSDSSTYQQKPKRSNGLQNIKFSLADLVVGHHLDIISPYVYVPIPDMLPEWTILHDQTSPNLKLSFRPP